MELKRYSMQLFFFKRTHLSGEPQVRRDHLHVCVNFRLSVTCIHVSFVKFKRSPLRLADSLDQAISISMGQPTPAPAPKYKGCLMMMVLFVFSLKFSGGRGT